MRILSQLSGGLDSVAALAVLLDRHPPESVDTLFIDYGQPYAAQEFDAACYAAEHFGVELLRRDMPLEVVSNTDVPEYIPMRNLALLALAVNLALARGCSAIAVGSKSAEHRPDDPYSFRDSTKQFFASMQVALDKAVEPGHEAPYILMPVVGWSKVEVIDFLVSRDVDINKLWSCYAAGSAPCGICHHCIEIQTAVDRMRLQKKAVQFLSKGRLSE
jgi:7-cyano-7-deazaguanine synthase